MSPRQALPNARGGTPKVVVPKIQKCELKAPEEINVYSDGSLINIKTHSFELAGAGVWWPERKEEQNTSEAEYFQSFQQQQQEGVALEAAIVGLGGSSTRAGIVAGMIAMAANEEVHMGTDSQSFHTRASIILQMIKNKQKPTRPWSTQKDGDLWHTFCEMATQKGPESINISKVKRTCYWKKHRGWNRHQS